MKVFILPFGKINMINSHIAEVIINDGVILDKSEVKVYQNIFRSYLKPPFSVLINKENAYSYSFEAQLEMGKINDVVSRAVVVYNQSAEMATQVLIDLNKDKNWNIKLFRDRKTALNWLLLDVNKRNAV